MLVGVAILVMVIWGMRSLQTTEDAMEAWLSNFQARMRFLKAAFLPNYWVASGIDHAIRHQFIEAFIEATNENCKSSVEEPGNLRFDFLQDAAEENKFGLEWFMDRKFWSGRFPCSTLLLFRTRARLENHPNHTANKR